MAMRQSWYWFSYKVTLLILYQTRIKLTVVNVISCCFHSEHPWTIWWALSLWHVAKRCFRCYRVDFIMSKNNVMLLIIVWLSERSSSTFLMKYTKIHFWCCVVKWSLSQVMNLAWRLETGRNSMALSKMNRLHLAAPLKLTDMIHCISLCVQQLLCYSYTLWVDSLDSCHHFEVARQPELLVGGFLFAICFVTGPD